MHSYAVPGMREVTAWLWMSSGALMLRQRTCSTPHGLHGPHLVQSRVLRQTLAAGDLEERWQVARRFTEPESFHRARADGGFVVFEFCLVLSPSL